MFVKGAARGFWVFGWGEIDLTEFKNVKQVGKNTYSLFKFFIWQNVKLVRSMNKELSLHEKYVTVQSNDKSMNKYYYSMVCGLYFIVITNRAFNVAIFNVL